MVEIAPATTLATQPVISGHYFADPARCKISGGQAPTLPGLISNALDSVLGCRYVF